MWISWVCEQLLLALGVTLGKVKCLCAAVDPDFREFAYMSNNNSLYVLKTGNIQRIEVVHSRTCTGQANLHSHGECHFCFKFP